MDNQILSEGAKPFFTITQSNTPVIIENYTGKSPKVGSLPESTGSTMPVSSTSTSSTSTTSSAPQLVGQATSVEETAFVTSSTEIARLLSSQSLRNPEIQQRTTDVCDRCRYVRANIAFPAQKTAKGDQEEAYARVSVLMGIGKSLQIQSLELDATGVSKLLSVMQLCDAFNNSPASKIILNLSENNHWDTGNGALQTLFAKINEKKSIQCLTLDRINFRRADRMKSLIGMLEGSNNITSLSLASGSTLPCLDDDGMTA